MWEPVHENFEDLRSMPPPPNMPLSWSPDYAGSDGVASPDQALFLGMHAPDTAPRPGALCSDELVRDSHWHYHDMHQIMVPFEAAFRLDVANGSYLIPRNLAAWIPAGISHRMSIRRVPSTSVFFPASMVADPSARIRVFRVSPLLREMLLEARRWPLTEDTTPTREAFFQAMAGLLVEWIDNEADLFLPHSPDAQLNRVLEFTARNRETNLAEVCAECGISERSLRRRLKKDTGLTWEHYRQRERLVH
ncbi:MAG: hypothetical protein ABW188_18190, partial [Rhodococcus fascians]